MGSNAPRSSDRTRANWTATMERYFIDLMLDQMDRGNRLGHTFNKQAWTDMLSIFNAKFGCKYDRDALKSQYTNLWKQYNDVKNLLEQNEFSWDGVRKLVVAPPIVWDAYLKVGIIVLVNVFVLSLCFYLLLFEDNGCAGSTRSTGV